MAALEEHLPALVRTSPPTSCAGLVRTIARVQGVDPASILTGGGSSDLVFLALTRWLSREDGYVLDPERLVERVRALRYDLIVIVNPNSPTGRHVCRAALEDAVAEMARHARVWIDETYVEYAGEGESLESFASTHENVVVCKSMSKVYGLSGVRVGYLCASRSEINALKPFSPPWAVGLIGQVAAVKALEDREYYRAQWAVTRGLRETLGHGLTRLGWDVVPGVAKFLLCHLPESGFDAAATVTRARVHGVFVRDVGSMGRSLGTHAVRVAVKDAPSNARILAALSG